MSESEIGANAETPETHILHFDYDDANRCTLIVRINNVRFRIDVDAKSLQSKSNKDNPVFAEYTDRLKALREQASHQQRKNKSTDSQDCAQASSHSGVDSGIDISDASSEKDKVNENAVDVDDIDDQQPASEDESLPAATEAKEDQETSLQNWLLSCMADEVARLAPKSDTQQALSLHDWYNTPTAFFELTVKKDNLTPVEEVRKAEVTKLRKTLDDLLPSLPLPKSICELPELPWVDPADITVISTSTHDPACPIHPALVSTRLPNSTKDATFFFKPVDPTQPSPTKREIQLLHKIHRLNLDTQINVPRLHGLVRSHNPDPSSSTSTMGLLLTPIPTPLTPLTEHLTPSSLPLSTRKSYADQITHIISVLHSHDIVFGDAKADNFLVDKDGKLWIIDFGGSYTEGWVQEEKAETVVGDWQGVLKIEGALTREDLSAGVDGDGNVDEDEDAVMDVEGCGCGSRRCGSGGCGKENPGREKRKRENDKDENGTDDDECESEMEGKAKKRKK